MPVLHKHIFKSSKLNFCQYHATKCIYGEIYRSDTIKTDLYHYKYYIEILQTPPLKFDQIPFMHKFISEQRQITAFTRESYDRWPYILKSRDSGWCASFAQILLLLYYFNDCCYCRKSYYFNDCYTGHVSGLSLLLHGGYGSGLKITSPRCLVRSETLPTKICPKSGSSGSRWLGSRTRNYTQHGVIFVDNLQDQFIWLLFDDSFNLKVLK